MVLIGFILIALRREGGRSSAAILRVLSADGAKEARLKRRYVTLTNRERRWRLAEVVVNRNKETWVAQVQRDLRRMERIRQTYLKGNSIKGESGIVGFLSESVCAQNVSF